MTTDPPLDKAALREHLIAVRSGLGPAARAEASATVCATLAELPELHGVDSVVAYAPVGAEVDIGPLLRSLLASGMGLALPRVTGETLALAWVKDLDTDLQVGWRGVREPAVGASVAPDAIGAAVVPGLGFDVQGRRLGYGGGHFDRLLARLAPDVVRIGVAFEAQILDALPAEPHDEPVTVIVTESGVRRP